MSVTNESPKHEAINFINQQSQTPAGLSCEINTWVWKQRRDPALSEQILPMIVSLCLACLHFFVCHGVAYCSDVYANEPS